MADLGLDPGFWRGRRVLVTGDTGFKGAWLSLWLLELGAAVSGYALGPPTTPSLWEQARLAEEVDHHAGDVRDAAGLAAALRAARPDVVVHMAAQSLVRRSFEDPVETYAVNVIGTVNLLDAVRRSGDVRVVVNVTSDKCYDNREWIWGYREDDPMGGHDPYSSSKGCAELVTASFRRSFFHAPDGPRLASARAGNVIGAGDWATDRLVPDVVRAALAGEPVVVRNPDSVRPWQHVQNPLSGYLLLAERLWDEPALAEGWNFGPPDEDARSVREVVERLAALWPGLRQEPAAASGPHEARMLRLDSSKARALLGWRPAWAFDATLDSIVDWHRRAEAGEDPRELTLEQLRRAGSATSAATGR